MYKFTVGIMILVGVGLLLAGISYLLMVLYGMPWDWGKFVAAVILAILGGISLAIGVDTMSSGTKKVIFVMKRRSGIEYQIPVWNLGGYIET